MLTPVKLCELVNVYGLYVTDANPRSSFNSGGRSATLQHGEGNLGHEEPSRSKEMLMFHSNSLQIRKSKVVVFCSIKKY